MSKAKIYASLAVVFLLWLQPFSYSQTNTVPTTTGELVFDPDPLIDAYGNLLIVKTAFSTTNGVEAEVTLISSLAQETKASYPGMFTRIRRGDVAVYAIDREPTASTATPETVSLVALVTGPGSLPSQLVTEPLSPGKIDLMRIDRATGGDVIYLIQSTSKGRFALVYAFNGTAFSQVGTPIPLP